jgi:acetolactate synthase-1/2/3 large subunit
MSKISVSKYLAKFLTKRGVKNVFMLSGTGSIHLDDAFASEKGLSYVCARHEAAAVMMASADSKLSNNLGVVIATTGPGGTNAIGGVAEAWVDSVPVLVISGQVHSSQISPNVRSFGIQGFNVIENVKNITNFAVQIKKPTQIKYILEKAIYFAFNKRPGPVWIDIPFDVQSHLIDEKKLIGYKPKLQPKKISKDLFKISNILKLINRSSKPVIIFGQAIRSSDSIEIFKKVLNKLKIPAISARMSTDILKQNNPYFFGMGGIRGSVYSHKILKQSDLFIVIGSSFTHSFAGDNYDLSANKKIVIVNIDKNEIKKPNFNPSIKLNIDVKSFLSNFSKHTQKTKLKSFKTWINKCNEIKIKNPIITNKFFKNPINSYFLIECINKNSKRNTIFVSDAGSANYVASQALRIKENQREITSGAFYSMGVALPMAIGAAKSNPKYQTIAITGDGSIELNIQELKTLSIHNLNVKLFIINNGGYASIRKSQIEMTGGRFTDDDDVLNFMKIANAYDIKYSLIKDYKKMSTQIKTILKNKKPEIIEVICDYSQEIIEPFNVS